MKINNKGFTIVELLVVVQMLVIFLVAIGWGVNIYKFSKCDFKAPYKAEIIRGIGIPAVPFGAIVGFFDINDSE